MRYSVGPLGDDGRVKFTEDPLRVLKIKRVTSFPEIGLTGVVLDNDPLETMRYWNVSVHPTPTTAYRKHREHLVVCQASFNFQ